MKILHVAQNSDGYEEVTLLANAVDRHNSLAVYEKDGTIIYTGGFLLNDTPEIRAMLDAIPKEKQYKFVASIKTNPFVKFYYDDAKATQQANEELGRKQIKKPSYREKMKGILMRKLAGV